MSKRVVAVEGKVRVPFLINSVENKDALKCVLAILWKIKPDFRSVCDFYNMYVDSCSFLGVERSMIFGYLPGHVSITRSFLYKEFAFEKQKWSLRKLLQPRQFKGMIDTLKMVVDAVEVCRTKLNLHDDINDVSDDSRVETNILTVLADLFYEERVVGCDGPHGIPEYLYTVCVNNYDYECDNSSGEDEEEEDDLFETSEEEDLEN